MAARSKRGPIRVLVVDDHSLFRRGLGAVLAAEPDLEVVGEAEDGTDAVDVAERTKPDVVVIDRDLRGLDGISATRAILAADPGTRVLMLAGSADEQPFFAAVRAGVAGYLLKGVSADEVPAAVRATARGQSLVSPSLAAPLLREFARLAEGHHPVEEPAVRLTDREREVLAEIARGRTNRQIADTLTISENTVKNHVRSLLEKLRLSTRSEAAAFAVRERIVGFDAGRS